MLEKDVHLVLRGVRNLQHLRYNQVVVGVITNSDDRVPDVLSSLGLKVNSRRFGSSLGSPLDSGDFDLDFSVMSYDVGHEKPDRRIFEAAEELATAVTLAKDQGADADEWQKVYVGDEYGKDVLGATGADWNAVLVQEDTGSDQEHVRWRDADTPGTLHDLFQRSNAVGFRSLTKLAEWLR
jgi:hypothetical protein